jgi:transcriptional regulator with XRE-family HTH domain
MIGDKLRAAREHRKLTLREVEERSAIFAEETGDDSYRISASWLFRLEREKHQLTASKLVVLAHVYGVQPEHLFRTIYPSSRVPESAPDETTLFPSDRGALSSHYKWGMIGKHDQFLVPLLPIGSYVQIDTRKRVIAPAAKWANEFQRPIYFLKNKNAYLCGWCESDPLERSLTLVPHPLSPAHRLSWKDREEVEIIGRVVAVTISFDQGQ